MALRLESTPSTEAGMPFSLRCPRCGELRFIAEENSPETVPCLGCGATLRIPRVEPAPILAQTAVAQPPPAKAELGSQNPFADRVGPTSTQQFETQNPYQPSALPYEPSPIGQKFFGPDPRLAGRGKRFVGRVLDTLFLVAPMIVIAFAAAGSMDEDALLLFAFSTVGFMALINAVLVTMRGQSVGKIALGTIIVRQATDEQVGFVHGVLLRMVVPTLIQSIPTVGRMFGIVDALFIFGADHQCLHDKIAGTKVLDVAKMHQMEDWSRKGLNPWDR
jgi:uncharacterized RDD family membrane protein YckC